MCAKRRVQQAWLQQWQASSPHPANTSSIEASPGSDVFGTSSASTKARVVPCSAATGKNSFNAFLYQARVPTISSPLCSCGRGSKIAKHILIHCSAFSAAWHQLKDNLGRLPDFKQLLNTPDRLQKLTKWVIQKGILGQYRRARAFLYPPRPASPANN
jgi:hypothetical protein